MRPAPATQPHSVAQLLFSKLLDLLSIECDAGDLRKSAIVFSPHPDDECLGCAGTILRKKRVGGFVKVVHMTDGQAANHADLISRIELKNLRRQEAANAARVLGLDESDTYFLEYEDGHLEQHAAPAAERVLQILTKERPEEIYIPYAREPVNLAKDHLATTGIVKRVLPRFGRSLVVWEYPVWFWMHWPWVALWQSPKPIIPTSAVARQSLSALFGLRAIAELRYAVDISEVLELKRDALAQHRSQMERIVPDDRWLTLNQIANGQFLSRFYHCREFFRRSEFRV
jgi:LmbE family N-acetylglucosaminyl deacetylase